MQPAVSQQVELRNWNWRGKQERDEEQPTGGGNPAGELQERAQRSNAGVPAYSLVAEAALQRGLQPATERRWRGSYPV